MSSDPIEMRLADGWPLAFDALSTDHPFVQSGFLRTLETHQVVSEGTGWQPVHASLENTAGELVAACPLYLKGHSHGEFVFDHALADAWQRAGGRYYPKLLVAVPYTPVVGPRLLSRTPDDATRLALGLKQFCNEQQLSSLHINFVTEQDAQVLRAANYLPRIDFQFHWRNRDYTNFDDFLDTLKPKKRKNIRAERRKVFEAGVVYRWVAGAKANTEDWQFAYHCYLDTFDRKGNWPVFDAACFAALGAALGDQIQLCIATQQEAPIACAIFLRSNNALYGRYWGTTTELDGLHFETCYYQGIEYAIAHDLATFEPGAQGQHKLARGFTPTLTRSFHHFPDPQFAAVAADFFKREAEHKNDYYRVLAKQHNPFRT